MVSARFPTCRKSAETQFQYKQYLCQTNGFQWKKGTEISCKFLSFFSTLAQDLHLLGCTHHTKIKTGYLTTTRFHWLMQIISTYKELIFF